MTQALYLADSYLPGFSATVLSVGPDFAILDRTAFYPTGGGQPSDVGRLSASDGRAWRVRAAEKSPEGILHRLEGGSPPEVGTRVDGLVDWDLRYRHMRYHTALHLLSGVVYHRFGSGITGGQIYADRARMDFSLPQFTQELAADLLDELNRRSAEGIPVRARSISRAELEADPSLVRVARDLLPLVDPVRLIEIGNFDVQADGGTHVRSTHEVGSARIERIENKGARNKRLYITLDPPSPGAGAGP